MPRILLIILAVLFLAYSISLVVTSNFNMGHLLVWILTACFAVGAIWYEPLTAWFRTGVGRVVFWVLVVLALMYAGMICFVAVSGYTNRATGREKTVIVLGAGLRKDRPSLLLRYRLDKAYEYAVANPDALIITTGGQGRDELVPEGQAMRDYLIAKGLAPERVVAEVKSTSTEQNFIFAMDIMKERGIDLSEPIVYVTNAFHCYRAGRYAAMAGFASAKALPAGIPLRSVPTCYLREVLAVLYYWTFRSPSAGPAKNFVGLLSLNKHVFYK